MMALIGWIIGGLLVLGGVGLMVYSYGAASFPLFIVGGFSVVAGISIVNWLGE